MDLYAQEQELRTVFTTEPEVDPAANKTDRASGYQRRSKLAKWGVRITFVALVSMISTAMLSDPTIRSQIDIGIAFWKSESPNHPSTAQTALRNHEQNEPMASSARTVSDPERIAEPGSRPPVSVLPMSAVPVRRAGN